MLKTSQLHSSSYLNYAMFAVTLFIMFCLFGLFFSDLQKVQVQNMEKVNLISEFLCWVTSVQSGVDLFSIIILNIRK